MKPTVHFLPVDSPQAKLASLCQIAQKCFSANKRLLFLVPSGQAAIYVDELLWKTPSESFLPHVIAESPCDSPVVITTAHENMNQSTAVFNLCPEVSPFLHTFQEVYELIDKTSPQKLAQSNARRASWA